MNEHGFIKSIHRKLNPVIHAWKINDSYQGGVADAYYSGNKSDIWIEYKYNPSLPVRPSTMIDPQNENQYLSALQRKWLTNRHNEGRSVFVIIGSNKGHVVFRGLEFKTPISVAEFLSRAITTQQIRDFIANEVLHED